MALVSNSIDSMINGVSQQPANLRLPSQCEAQVNGYTSVASGLGKRAPTEYLAKLQSGTLADAFIHIINRDTTERYAVVITDELVQVFDLLDGSAETVTFETFSERVDATAYALEDVVSPTTRNGFLYRCTTAGTSHASTEPTWPLTLGDTVSDGTVTWTCIQSYFAVPAGSTARETFEVVTLADYSFIVNKSIVVDTYDLPSSAPGNYSSWYFPTNWSQTAEERTYDAVAGSDQGAVTTMADLPAAPSPGDFYEVTGDDGSGFTSFYVMRVNGAWQETHDHASAISLDPATMPQALIREADAEFHVREFGWIPRLFGNDLTNPAPSFVGTTINDLGYHKNRLVFAAGENLIFSGAGDYGNFFRNTVTQLLDSDVVDVAVSSQSVSTIRYILPAENGMMFFSDQAQFVLNVDQLLTPSTVSIDVATSYEMSNTTKPISIGQDVYFATESGKFSRIREYAVGGGGNITTDATDVTAHVERYVPEGLIAFAGSSNEDVLLAVSGETGFKNRVYVYKFFYSGNEKVQSAWSYWQLADDDVILACEVLNNKAYFIIERADGVYLEFLNVRTTEFPLALDYNILLDRRYNFEGGDKSFDGTYTTFTLPYELTAGEQADFRLVEADGATDGVILNTSLYTFPTATTVRIIADYTSTEIIGGLNYTFSYTFSEQFHRVNGAAITTGKNQLRAITVVYEDMAYFSTSVDPYGTTDFTVLEPIVTEGLSAFTGKTLGEASLLVGSPVFGSGTYEFQIYGNSKVAKISLTNDVPFGGSFVSATVESFFTNRGR